MPTLPISETTYIRLRYAKNNVYSSTVTGYSSTPGFAAEACWDAGRSNIRETKLDGQWNDNNPVTQVVETAVCGQDQIYSLYNETHTTLATGIDGDEYFCRGYVSATAYNCLVQVHLKLDLSGLSASNITSAKLYLTSDAVAGRTFYIGRPTSTLLNIDTTYYHYDNSNLTYSTTFTKTSSGTSAITITNEIRDCINNNCPYLIITCDRKKPYNYSTSGMTLTDITIKYTSSITQSFSANGGTFGSSTAWNPVTKTIAENNTTAQFTIPANGPTWAGHTFLGWSRLSNAASPYIYASTTAQSVNLTKDRLWYAIWDTQQFKPVYIKINGVIKTAYPYIKINGNIKAADFTVKTS